LPPPIRRARDWDDIPPKERQLWRRLAETSGKLLEDTGKLLRLPQAIVDQVIDEFMGDAPRWIRRFGARASVFAANKWAAFGLAALSLTGRSVEASGYALRRLATDPRAPAKLRMAAHRAIAATAEKRVRPEVLHAVLSLIQKDDRYSGWIQGKRLVKRVKETVQ
jgi:hypothetical protein